MIIYVDGKRLEAEKIIKTSKNYKGYNGEDCVFIVALNKDVTGEYIEEVSPEERLEALETAMLEMILGGVADGSVSGGAGETGENHA